MNLNIILKRSVFLLFAMATVSGLTSCSTDAVGDGNGLSDPNVDAAFTITPVSGAVNNYTLNAQTTNVIASKWDIGEGAFVGKMSEVIALPDAGTYTIKHTAIGRGGLTNTVAQELVVATSDPAKGNLVLGGRFANAADHAKWTILKISDSGTSWSFNSGSATIKGGGWNQQGIYQAIQVQAGKEYKIDMKVFGGGSSNTWFEVYASKTVPVQNSDYSAEGRRMGMSTWDGCATGSFEGKLSAVGCVGSGNVVKFAESGTIYLVIKCGGENIGATGISITNVEMRGK
ncbi:hypothetical protein [Flavobacterium restrictum]|uniref:PKD domain-containing protein n=1 Tax=Flavobacterium restrictum TaxID=2594428 RepID=A0A553EBD3_9FLAO|nr:hypothetical protein [Flavobacterium restrictum]TRX42265.1 hypothetical protein FNW21_03125 [Flavobacterium restrictum]